VVEETHWRSEMVKGTQMLGQDVFEQPDEGKLIWKTLS